MFNSLLRSRAFAALLVALSVGLSAALTGCKSNATPAKEASSSHAKSAAPSAEASLARLVSGNVRYAAGEANLPDYIIEAREALVHGQEPFAVVLTCSDSRVPPELVFHAGLGDLFVVRVAGNTADPVAVGSIEYAVAILHAPLIVVLGHDRCGAADAAVKQSETGIAPPANIGAVTGPILPAVAKARQKPGDVSANTVHENIDHVVEQLKTSKPILSEAVNSGAVKIIGGYYDLHTGKVEFK